MAEYTYNPIQLVQPNQPVILNDSLPCMRGYVFHRNESGIVTLRGIVNNPCGCFARYQVTFNGNIAVPEDGTVGAIAIAIALDGEPILTSRAIVTPAAVDEYFNVTSTAIITIPSYGGGSYRGNNYRGGGGYRGGNGGYSRRWRVKFMPINYANKSKNPLKSRVFGIARKRFELA